MKTDRELLELAAKTIGNPTLKFNGAIWSFGDKPDPKSDNYPDYVESARG